MAVPADIVRLSETAIRGLGDGFEQELGEADELRLGCRGGGPGQAGVGAAGDVRDGPVFTVVVGEGEDG